MKKNRLIAALLALLLVFSFAGCAEKKPESLRVCVDIEYVGGEKSPFSLEPEMNLFLSRLVYAGGPKNVKVEYLPKDGIERETTLSRIRTEIMSGGGPDVFIMACNDKDYVFSEEALFPMPEKAFNLAWFLPLDEYMENNTQFAEWDKMNTVVLEAGRGEEGQQILPLCYTIPVSVYARSSAAHTPSKEITWMNMLESDDQVLAASAVWTDGTSKFSENCPFFKVRDSMTEFILGELADYEEEKLLFTEEELGQRMEEIFTLAERYRAGVYEDAPAHYNAFMGFMFDRPSSFTDISKSTYNTQCGIETNEPYTLVPLYSDDGGVTAEIAVYAAINRNTHLPEDAYCLVDYLLSRKAQSSEGIYQHIYSCGTGNLSMYNDLMDKENMIYRSNPESAESRGDPWYLSDDNFPEFCDVRDQITYARFRDTLDIVFDELYWEYLRAVDNGEDTEQVISAYYSKMRQRISE